MESAIMAKHEPQKRGRPVHESKSKPIQVRLDPRTWEAIVQMAAEEDRSWANMVAVLASEAIAARQRRKSHPPE